MSLRSAAPENGSGVSTVMSHITSAHPDALGTARLEAGDVTTLPNLARLCWPEKTLCIHAWLDLVVAVIQPFLVVENMRFAKQFQHDKSSRITFMKYLQRLTEKVKTHISARLPSKLALVFDGWSASYTHYMALFATFSSATGNGYSKILLALSPFEAEDDLRADQHMGFPEYGVARFGKSLHSVVALTGDNCSINKSFFRKMGCVFVGCMCHRFNLSHQYALND